MAKSEEKKALEAYLMETRTWETDKVIEERKSKRIAWIIAGVASFIALAAVIGIAGLTPLKEREPYVLRVNDTAGTVDIISVLKDAKEDYGEAVAKYFTQQYVRFREGYSKELAEDYYNAVGILSGQTEQGKYLQWFHPQNPQSPLTLYGDTAKVKIEVKGTTFLKSNIAHVRYAKKVEFSGNEKPQITHWAATIVFKYSTAPMSEKNRAINPLGFQVLEYRNDPDAQVEARAIDTTAQPTAAPAQAAPARTISIMPGNNVTVPVRPQQTPIVPAPAIQPVPVMAPTQAVPAAAPATPAKQGG